MLEIYLDAALDMFLDHAKGILVIGTLLFSFAGGSIVTIVVKMVHQFTSEGLTSGLRK
jgi:uncharacterized membrane protein YczE